MGHRSVLHCVARRSGSEKSKLRHYHSIRTRTSVKWRTIQRGLGKQRVDGASFRLMEEGHYIQERAAEQDSRVITLPQLLLSSTQPAMPGCSNLPIILLFRWPAKEILCQYTSRKRTRTSPLAGQEPTASMAKLSSTLNETQAGSAPSSATQHGISSSRQDLRISNILG
jgi:hypothetical protein